MVKENFYHDKATVKFLNMISSGKAKRNSKGVIVRDASYQKRKCAPVSKIAPNRIWFSDTKTITQNELENFRNQTNTKTPYQVLLSKGKIPYTLLKPTEGKKRRIDDYDKVFGKSATRKKPKLDFSSMEQLIEQKNEKKATIKTVDNGIRDKTNQKYIKGQSKRIWNEFYKVMDSSDVILHVLDARDPLGSLCSAVEKYIEKKSYKHLVYVLNKVDLVPTSVTNGWIQYFKKKAPTLAFHSSALNNHYGKSHLMSILRQYAGLHKDKKEISVGFIGYPNIGKSSIINVLRDKKVCEVAPVPGYTKIWKYIALSSRIYLIDCPGIVPITDEKSAVLRGAIRFENVTHPEIYIDHIIEKANDSIRKLYGLNFTDCDDLLDKVAQRFGKLLKNGEKDTQSAAKILLRDWYDGRITYFTKPPQEIDNLS